MSRVEFNDDLAKQLLSSTLLQVLTQEKKDALLTEAITKVLTEKERQSYGQELPRLQKIFQEVVYEHAKTRVRELLATDAELQAKLEETTKAMILTAFDTVKNNISEMVQKTLEKAMTGRSY